MLNFTLPDLAGLNNIVKHVNSWRLTTRYFLPLPRALKKAQVARKKGGRVKKISFCYPATLKDGTGTLSLFPSQGLD